MTVVSIYVVQPVNMGLPDGDDGGFLMVVAALAFVTFIVRLIMAGSPGSLAYCYIMIWLDDSFEAFQMKKLVVMTWAAVAILLWWVLGLDGWTCFSCIVLITLFVLGPAIIRGSYERFMRAYNVFDSEK